MKQMSQLVQSVNGNHYNMFRASRTSSSKKWEEPNVLSPTAHSGDPVGSVSKATPPPGLQWQWGLE